MKREIEYLKGFQDFLPQDMIPFQKMLDKVRQVYESYGFRPQMTPVIEALSLLEGEEGETGKQIYRMEDKEGNRLGLRFDLTMPLSRIITLYAKELRFPYKRYQYGRVFRYDKPRPGRFREFGQFDGDIIGSSSILADGEICALIRDVMRTLGFSHFLVRVNSRKILTGLAQKLDLQDSQKDKQLFRELDKLDKQGWKQVKKTLLTGVHEEKKASIGFQLTPKQVDMVEEYLAISAPIQWEPAEEGKREIPQFYSYEKILKNLEDFFGENQAGRLGMEELQGLMDFLAEEDQSWLQIDTNIARGLDYYTGPVFETVLVDHPGYGAVYSGGRYDFLLGRFIDFKSFFKEFQEYRQKWKDPLTGQPILPAVGASLGIDRLFAILKDLKLLQPVKTLTQVLVVTMDTNLFLECRQIAEKLRHHGIVAELYTGESRSIKHQLRYADRLEIPLALLYGENEHKENVVAIKDLRKDREDKTKQKPIPKEKMVSEIQKLLEETSGDSH